MARELTYCYVDESVHDDYGFVTTSFVFTEGEFESEVEKVLLGVGLVPREQEIKSSLRMDANPAMRAGRDALLNLAGSRTRIAVSVGPYDRRTIGKHCLQALQSVLLRNGMEPSLFEIHFDQGIFPSEPEAHRLRQLFHFLNGAQIFPWDDSRVVLGIQVADIVAHSFAQIIKAELSDKNKEIHVGGERTDYPEGSTAPLGWSLLMSLRHALLTRPMVYEGEEYHHASDPVVLDPMNDDPTMYGQHPILLGWGVQVAPEATLELRCAVEHSLGRVWLGCIH